MDTLPPEDRPKHTADDDALDRAGGKVPESPDLDDLRSAADEAATHTANDP